VKKLIFEDLLAPSSKPELWLPHDESRFGRTLPNSRSRSGNGEWSVKDAAEVKNDGNKWRFRSWSSVLTVKQS